jgi:hypothetical protein
MNTECKNKDLEVILQIFSGGFLDKAVSYEEVERKLNSVLSRLPVRKVIMGWALDKTLYEKTAEFLDKHNIDFYLWFPMFSETGALKDLNALIDFMGQCTEILPEEDFSFCCPADSQNMEKILDIFDKEFSSIRFNGVFLDRIRYPSFANAHGFNSVFSCFCPHCLAIYERENFDIDRLKNALSHPACKPSVIKEYCGSGKYVFEDPILEAFFSLKSGIILDSLRRICGHFREKGYGIGFDVFAPFLSPFVGQNLVRLSGLCDFIKPMMYRVTRAPAGLPFEAEALLKETDYVSDLESSEFFKLTDTSAMSFADIKKIPFNLNFAARELQDLSFSSACPVYAGVEINRIKDIAEAHPPYLEETIMGYVQTGIKGFALSWDLLDAPEENIVKATDIIKRINR